MIKVDLNRVKHDVDKIYVHHNGERREVESVCYGKNSGRHRYFCGYKPEDIIGVEFILEKYEEEQGGGTLTIGSNYVRINARSGNTITTWFVYVVIITNNQKRWLISDWWDRDTDFYYSYLNACATTMFHDVVVSCNVTFSLSFASNSTLEWKSGLINDFPDKLSNSSRNYTTNVLFSPPQPDSYYYNSGNDGILGLGCSKGSGSITMTINSIKIGERKLNITFREGTYKTLTTFKELEESRNNNGKSSLSNSGSSI